MAKLLSLSLFDAEKQNDRPELRRLECNLDSDCEMFKRGQCIHLQIFGSGCVYGRKDYEKGPTKRSKKYWEWMKKARAEIQEHKDLPRLNYPKDCMAFIGEYVYLPYSHIAMCQLVPFVRHDHFFVSGIPFVKKEEFTPQAVLDLVQFHPHSLMGPEITDYAQKSVPLFLFHLKHFAPDLFKVSSELAAQKNIPFESRMLYIGDKPIECSIDCVPSCSGGFRFHKAFEVTQWDGTTLTARSTDDAALILLGIYRSESKISCKPDPKTKVTVFDPSLIQKIAIEHPEVVVSS